MNDRNQIHKLSSNQILDLDSVDVKVSCSFSKEQHVYKYGKVKKLADI